MITDIRLQHFRSYSDATFEFGEGVNIIVGPNASGKTNLLEAIQLVCLGGSYRARDRELIKFNKPWARLDAHTGAGERSIKLETQETLVKKTFIVGGQIHARLPFAKSIPAVLFEPEDLQLLRGGPQRRRDFLDDLLEQTIPGYSKLRRQYLRALSQRNSLLKKGHHIAEQQIFAWNLRLSELGAQIVGHRRGLLKRLNDDLPAIYQKLSHSKTPITLEYVGANSGDYGSWLLRKLESSLDLDLARGFTGTGPHRDDIAVILKDHPTQTSASRGEVRTLLLALKIVELKLLEEIRGQRPILLLDDVFSELDGKRRQALTKFLKNYQTFITTTDADVVVQHFMDTATIIPTTK
jgi:DNA replication and repair protein RecF